MTQINLKPGQILTGSLFSEPMRVETVQCGQDCYNVGLVGTQTDRFRKVILTKSDLAELTILNNLYSYDGDGELLRLGIQAYSLENRSKRLESMLSRAQDLLQLVPPDLPTAEELEEMEDTERARLEELLEAITISSNAKEIQEEISKLKELADQTKAVEESGGEAKLSRLKQLMQEEGLLDLQLCCCQYNRRKGATTTS